MPDSLKHSAQLLKKHLLQENYVSREWKLLHQTRSLRTLWKCFAHLSCWCVSMKFNTTNPYSWQTSPTVIDSAFLFGSQISVANNLILSKWCSHLEENLFVQFASMSNQIKSKCLESFDLNKSIFCPNPKTQGIWYVLSMSNFPAAV